MSHSRDELLIRYNTLGLDLARIADALRMPLQRVIENCQKFSPEYEQKITNILEAQVVILRQIKEIDIHALCAQPIVNINEYKHLVGPRRRKPRQ